MNQKDIRKRIEEKFLKMLEEREKEVQELKLKLHNQKLESVLQSNGIVNLNQDN